MPVEFGPGASLANGEMLARLEQFSQQLGGRTVRVLRGDTAAPPPVPSYEEPPAYPQTQVVPPQQQRRGCLGQLFSPPQSPPPPPPRPDPGAWQARAAGEAFHAQGLAADIAVDGLTTRDVSEAAARSGLFAGVGHYDAGADAFAHTHVDIGPVVGSGTPYGAGVPGAAPPRLWMAAAAGALGGAAAGTLAWNYFENQRRRAVGDS